MRLKGARLLGAKTAGVRAPPKNLQFGDAGSKLERMAKLNDLGVDVEDTIGRVRVPSYMIDSQGIVRWLNPAAEKLVGDVRGRHYTSVVAPEETQRAQTIFTRNLFGSPTGSDNKAVVIGADGERLSVEVSAVPVRSGNRVIGVFGQVKDIDEQKPFATPEHLTPRQTRGAAPSRSWPLDRADRARASHKHRDGSQPHPRRVAGVRCELPSRGGRHRPAMASAREPQLGLNLEEERVPALSAGRCTRRSVSCPPARPSRRGGSEKPRTSGAFHRSGRRDLNSGPLVPQTSALTRLRHAPFAEV